MRERHGTTCCCYCRCYCFCCYCCCCLVLSPTSVGAVSAAVTAAVIVGAVAVSVTYCLLLMALLLLLLLHTAVTYCCHIRCHILLLHTAVACCCHIPLFRTAVAYCSSHTAGVAYRCDMLLLPSGSEDGKASPFLSGTRRLLSTSPKTSWSRCRKSSAGHRCELVRVLRVSSACRLWGFTRRDVSLVCDHRQGWYHVSLG